MYEYTYLCVIMRHWNKRNVIVKTANFEHARFEPEKSKTENRKLSSSNA